MLVVNRNDHAPIAERLILRQAENGQSPVFCEGDWWSWNGRHWAHLPVSHLKRDLARINDWAVWRDGKSIATSSHFFSSIISIAEALASEPGFFSDPTPGVAFRSSFVRLTTDGGLEEAPNSHEHLARWSYDFDWDPSARCPRWMEFMDQVWTRPPVGEGAIPDPDDKEEKKKCLAQFVGASLTGTAHIGQRAVMLVGQGGNGKSVLCDAVRDIFPPGSTTSVPPQDLRTPERVSRLAGARLNVVSDIPQRGLTDTGLMKQVISGDVVDARKLYSASFSFRPVCGHLFSANGIPATNDYSSGFQRRWIIMDFPNSFLGSGVRRSTPELLGMFRAEQPGIVRWALEGVSELMTFREYCIPESSADAVRRWRLVNDQVACFLEECTERSEEWGLTTNALYVEYERWVKGQGGFPVGKRNFSERVANLGIPHRRIGKTGREWTLHMKYDAGSDV